MRKNDAWSGLEGEAGGNRLGADIVATVTAPLTWQSVGLLGMIVLIRTLLSFSLEIEIEGVVPWRRRERDMAGSARGV